MTTQNDIETLKSQLMQAQAELSAIRSERNTVDIRAEVEKRGGTDHAAISALITKNTRKNGDGALCAIDEAGEFRFGSGQGAYMPITELLDELARSNPGLFSGTAQGNTKGYVGPNPFAKGSFNLSQQMYLLKTQPQLAEHLQYIATVGKN